MKLPTFLEFQNPQQPSWWNLTNLDHDLTGIPSPWLSTVWNDSLHSKKKNRLLICPQNRVNHSFSLVEWNFMAESKSNAWPLETLNLGYGRGPTFAENQCLHHIFVNYEFGIVASRCLVLSVEPTLESSTDCCLGCWCSWCHVCVDCCCCSCCACCTALLFCWWEYCNSLLDLHLRYSTRREFVLIAIPKPVNEDSRTESIGFTLSTV